MEVNHTSLNLVRILNVLKKRWIIVVVLALVFGAASYYYTANFVTKKYSASVKMYVYNEETSITYNGQTYTSSVTASDLSLRSLVISDCLVCVTLPDVINTVNTQLKEEGYNGTISAGNISAVEEDATRFFTITVKCADKKLCNRAIELIAEASLKQIKGLLKVDNVRAVAYSKSGGPISPNVSSNATTGAFAGAVVGFAIIALMAVSDRTIKNEDDFNELFPDLPVIGTIPEFNLANEKVAAARSKKNSGRYQSSSAKSAPVMTNTLPPDLNSFDGNKL